MRRCCAVKRLLGLARGSRGAAEGWVRVAVLLERDAPESMEECITPAEAERGSVWAHNLTE